LKQLLPAIIYCGYSWMGNDVELLYLLHEIPFYQRMLLKNVWMKQWKKYCLNSMLSIINDNKPLYNLSHQDLSLSPQ